MSGDGSACLTPADLAIFKAIGVSEHLAVTAGVRRVTHDESRELCGIRYKSDHLEGIGFPYLNPGDDQVVTWRVRRDHPEVETDGTPIAKYVSPPDRKHLYFVLGAYPQLGDTSAPVIIVEAEKSVLAIAAARLQTNRTPWPLIVATGGCWGWRGVVGKATSANGARVDQKGPLPDFNKVTWTGRDTIIVFDSNVQTNTKVQAARKALAAELTQWGARVRIADLPVEAGINGPDDYIGKHGAAAFWTLIDAAKPATTSPRTATGKESQATAIVRLVTEARAELWHEPNGDPYISILVGHHQEHYPLGARGCKDYVTRLYFTDEGKAPNASALQDAIATLSGIARYDGAEHHVHVRVAGDHDDRIYLDLSDPLWRAVEITRAGWQVVTNPPVRFRRPRGVLPLPVPAPGGSIEELRAFVNVANADDFTLMVMWELAALRPRGPYPILIFMAEQGAAKTTTTRVLRRLCDPNDSDVRRPPRNTEDLMIAATNGHVVAFDNLSRLPEDLSDNLSVLATGGGFAVRQLYTNREEEIFNAQKPIILNGISQVATRGDLLDRAIVITLPPIPEERRRDEATFWAAFDRAHPRLLGALLDAVVVGLQRVADVHLPRMPRMADFAIWGVATEPACPWGTDTFLRAYSSNRQGAVEATLEGDPVADVVQVIAPWEGTAGELLGELTRRTSDTITKRKDWFSKPRQVADALRRLAPALRRTGIEISFQRQGHGRKRLITLEKNAGSASSASSASSTRPNSPAERADAGADDMPRTQPDSSASSSAHSLNVYAGQDAADAADALRGLFSADVVGESESEKYAPGPSPASATRERTRL